MTKPRHRTRCHKNHSLRLDRMVAIFLLIIVVSVENNVRGGLEKTDRALGGETRGVIRRGEAAAVRRREAEEDEEENVPGVGEELFNPNAAGEAEDAQVKELVNEALGEETKGVIRRGVERSGLRHEVLRRQVYAEDVDLFNQDANAAKEAQEAHVREQAEAEQAAERSDSDDDENENSDEDQTEEYEREQPQESEPLTPPFPGPAQPPEPGPVATLVPEGVPPPLVTEPVASSASETVQTTEVYEVPETVHLSVPSVPETVQHSVPSESLVHSVPETVQPSVPLESLVPSVPETVQPSVPSAPETVESSVPSLPSVPSVPESITPAQPGPVTFPERRSENVTNLETGNEFSTFNSSQTNLAMKQELTAKNLTQVDSKLENTSAGKAEKTTTTPQEQNFRNVIAVASDTTKAGEPTEANTLATLGVNPLESTTVRPPELGAVNLSAPANANSQEPSERNASEPVKADSVKPPGANISEPLIANLTEPAKANSLGTSKANTSESSKENQNPSEPANANTSESSKENKNPLEPANANPSEPAKANPNSLESANANASEPAKANPNPIEPANANQNPLEPANANPSEPAKGNSLLPAEANPLQPSESNASNADVSATQDEGKFTSDSQKLMDELRNKLPGVLRDQLIITDEAEAKVLEDYATGNTGPSEAIAAYNAAKKDERETLKLMIPEAGLSASLIIDDYKALRRGEAWIHVKLGDQFKAFFQRPSQALKDYESLKKDEFLSLDGFLSGQSDEDDDEELAEGTDFWFKRRARARAAVKRGYGDGPDGVVGIEEVKDAVNGQSVEPISSVVDISLAVTNDSAKVELPEDNNSLLKIAMFYSLVVQLVVVTTFLVAYRAKIAEWCCRRGNSTETEPLRPRNQHSAIERGTPTSWKISIKDTNEAESRIYGATQN